MKPVVVLGFDMETDIGSWTPFYEGLQHGTPRVLEVLNKHSARATFFFTGEAAATHPEVVKTVDEAGHEVGTHSIHHETLGDELFPIPGVRPVLPEEVFNRLRIATEMVEQTASRKMRSFRAPRLWGSTAIVNALEQLGYAADASYPLYYYRDRLAPYYPSRADWTVPGDSTVLEIPNFADVTIDSRDPYGRDRDQWPLFRTDGAEALVVSTDRMLDVYRRESLPAVLCLYLHPWEFHNMPSGPIHYGEGSVIPDPFIIKNCGEPAVRELDRLIGLLKDRGAVLSTAEDLARDWASRSTQYH